MYSIGDTILYNPSGVCTVEDIREEDLMGNEMEYYILKPCFNNGSTIYVPVSNETLVSRMKDLLPVKDVKKLISGEIASSVSWVDDSKKRTVEYNEIIAQNNRADMIQIVRLLLKHKQDVALTNHKFYSSDEKILVTAKRLISEEFAMVLDTTLESIYEQLRV